ncbi:MAG: peptidoglycan DD-metalloendopeptidase family protein [Acidiferrobacterales bacterium]
MPEVQKRDSARRVRAGRMAVLWVVTLLGFLVIGCSGPRIRPVISDRATSMRHPESRYRTVLHGDTLYSIAWESGRDYRELAVWNDIAAPYTIQPGQRLRLFPPRAHARMPPSPSISRVALPAAGPPRPSVPARTAPRPLRPHATFSAERGVGPWVWPAKGRILSGFNHSGTENGLDIAGWRGEPVLAAAAGKVVYQGSGLRGYGQLIIIKHNDEYLSAYAHNERILVKDGEIVKRGQEIAEMGDTGTDRVKLHFEIRRHGSPVNPLKYLPKL